MTSWPLRHLQQLVSLPLLCLYTHPHLVVHLSYFHVLASPKMQRTYGPLPRFARILVGFFMMWFWLTALVSAGICLKMSVPPLLPHPLPVCFCRNRTEESNAHRNKFYLAHSALNRVARVISHVVQVDACMSKVSPCRGVRYDSKKKENARATAMQVTTVTPLPLPPSLGRRGEHGRPCQSG